MEMRYENGLGLHVSIRHVNTLIKSLNEIYTSDYVL